MYNFPGKMLCIISREDLIGSDFVRRCYGKIEENGRKMQQNPTYCCLSLTFKNQAFLSITSIRLFISSFFSRDNFL